MAPLRNEPDAADPVSWPVYARIMNPILPSTYSGANG